MLPPNVPQDVWDSWQASWNTLEFKKKCLATSKFLLSKVVGPDIGISRHTRGSKSAIDHYLDLVNNYSMLHIPYIFQFRNSNIISTTIVII